MKKILIIIMVITIIFTACDAKDPVEPTLIPTAMQNLESTPALTETPTITPTPTVTPELILEGFDNSYENGDMSNINVAVKGEDIYYVYSKSELNSDLGTIYRISKNNEEAVGSIVQNNYYNSLWGYKGKYIGNIKINSDYLYYNSQDGMIRMNINTDEKEELINNDDVFEIAKERVDNRKIKIDNGIENFIVHNNIIYFRFKAKHITDYLFYNTVCKINLDGSELEVLEEYMEHLIYSGIIVKDKKIYIASTIYNINNDNEIDAFAIKHKAYNRIVTLSQDKIYFSSCRYLDGSSGSDVQGFDINTYEEIYYEEYDYDRIYIESANQYIFKFFFDEEWTPQTMSLMDTKNDVEYSEDELRELIVGDFELEQFYTAYWCMEDGAMYLCSPGETEDTAFCKIYRVVIEDGKMIFDLLYTHEEPLEN